MLDDPIDNLARVRGEDRAATERYMARLATRLVPARLIDPTSITALPIVETGIDWPYAFARLDGGRTLYSYPSNATRMRQFWMIRDKLPKTITAATFGVAADISRRYAYDDPIEPDKMTGWCVVEAGAYIGFKAMRFADKVGPGGRVVAVEIDRANHELMRLNIEANGLSGVISPVHAGLHAEDGDRAMVSDGYQKHSLVAIDGLRQQATRSVRCMTLDTLLDEQQLDRIDYLNVQVNGAEADLLTGLKRHVRALRQFHIVSRYDVGQKPVRPAVLRWLSQHGFVVSGQSPRSIFGQNAT